MTSQCDITNRHCVPCEGGVAPLSAGESRDLLASLPGWALSEGRIEKSFPFRDHYETMTFVNAIAWVSHLEGHHPDLAVGYNSVTVRYWTHAISGLSENDFICAAKIEKLLTL
jgi:4a-hydroxytetrahydrobiopterin dehydratase